MVVSKGNGSRGCFCYRRVKVLHVIPSVSPKHGGPTYAMHAVATALQVAGVEILIATSDDDGDDARLDVPLGVPIERDGIQHIVFRRSFLKYRVSFGLARWLKHNVSQFDIIHIHALFSFSSLVAARAARRHNVPYIIRPLGVLNRWGLENRRRLAKRLSLRFIELPILRGAAAIHFTSEAERREAAEICGELALNRSCVIPVPVEGSGSAGHKEEFIRKFPVSAGRKLILFLSRVDQKKGIELLLEAFAIVKRSQPNALLVIAGDGEARYVDELHSQAKRLGLASDVLWTGFVEKADKANAYAAASVFVLPSHSENFGIAAAEALTSGVPCVLSDQVALTEYLQNGDSALVVSCESAAIAKALCDVLSKPEMGAQLAARGQQVAKERFSLEAVGRGLMDLYRSIVSGKGV